MKLFQKSILAFSLLTANFSFGQTTITLQPDAINGKDALIESRRDTTNFGNALDFMAADWTNGGIPVTVRAIIDFDFNSIPSNAVITSAELSLYGYTSVSNVGHSTQSGSNESVLKRITQSWNEQNVNWINQPNTTALNEVILQQSTSVNQHYLNINVTNLVQDMISDRINSHGFMLQLKTEQYYRSLLFASSDNTDSTIRPKLVITYNISTGLQKDHANKGTIDLYPSPATGETTFIRLNNFTERSQTIQLINASGSIVKETTVNSEVTPLIFKGYLKGFILFVFPMERILCQND